MALEWQCGQIDGESIHSHLLLMVLRPKRVRLLSLADWDDSVKGVRSSCFQAPEEPQEEVGCKLDISM
jgi:hypothetical protein